MEDIKKAEKNKGQGEDSFGREGWTEGGDSIQDFKKIWRRVFNKRIGCYEIYIGQSNYLVATGITDKSDSFLVGTIPLMVKLLHNFCRGCVKGEIDIETYEETKRLIKIWKREQPLVTRTNTRNKGGKMDRVDLQQLNFFKHELEQAGGGSYSDFELLP